MPIKKLTATIPCISAQKNNKQARKTGEAIKYLTLASRERAGVKDAKRLGKIALYFKAFVNEMKAIVKYNL